MKHCRALDAFLQTRWGKPNASTTPTFLTISRNSPQISVFRHAYCAEMCYNSSSVLLIFSKTINRKKNAGFPVLNSDTGPTSFIQPDRHRSYSGFSVPDCRPETGVDSVTE